MMVKYGHRCRTPLSWKTRDLNDRDLITIHVRGVAFRSPTLSGVAHITAACRQGLSRVKVDLSIMHMIGYS
jgi:hypothetical protein